MHPSFPISWLALLLVSFYFLIADGLWISFFVLDTYKSILQTSLSDFQNPLIPAVAVFVYLLLLGGLVCLALPLVKKDNWLLDALYYGGLYGLVVYGVYSGTNFAVVQDWNLWLLLTDCLWGMFICASSLVLYIAIILMLDLG